MPDAQGHVSFFQKSFHRCFFVYAIVSHELIDQSTGADEFKRVSVRKLDALVGYAIHYLRDFVLPTKTFREPSEPERAALSNLQREGTVG